MLLSVGLVKEGPYIPGQSVGTLGRPHFIDIKDFIVDPYYRYECKHCFCYCDTSDNAYTDRFWLLEPVISK